MADRLRKVTAALLTVLLVLMNTIGSPAQAEQMGRQQVRVGYLQMQGFIYKDADGQYSGLAYDLLREIAACNNWEFVFYECGYAEVEDLFASGRIDLFVSYQETPDRAEVFEYSRQVFCNNRASLLTVPGSAIEYDDYADLDGCTIGALAGTRNAERFQAYLLEQGCTVTVKQDYIHRQELLEAMDQGEIDAFISASNRGITDYKIVAQLPQTASYVIAPKGCRTFLDPLDAAMEKIDLEMPTLIHALEEKYLTTTEGRYPSLSAEETVYIAKKQNVTVLITRDECDESGAITGSAKVLFDSISAMTGLTFTPVVASGTTALMEAAVAGETDIVYSFNRDFDWAEAHELWPTCSYADFYNKRITRVGQGEISSVAVVPGSYTAYYLARHMDYATVECASYAACIDAVLTGKADATYCNSPIGNYYSTFPKYSRLSFLTAFDMSAAYCLGVSKKSDQILVGILNKSILCIPQSTLSSVYEVQMNSRPVTLMDVFYANPVACSLLLLVVMGVVLSLILSGFYLRRIRRKNEQLAVASSAKTDFMSRMSHDMRTPMNGILGLTQLTKSETDPEVIRTNLDQIELSGKVLLSLINDTLDMNKLEGGKLKLRMRPINSEEVFGNIIANARIMAADKGVELKLTLPQIGHGQWVPVLADASRLEQVLLNVISNAIKFTPPGGTVELIMKTVDVSGGVVRDQYIIRDSGIGMSPEFLPHLFDAFSQEKRDMNAGKTRDQGTGLGMSIVKQLVTLMGGEIHVTSEKDHGTEVTLDMRYPIYDGVLEKVNEAPADLKRLQGRRVLLCEDHPINARIAIKLLEKVNMQVDLAENGQEGLDRFKAAAAGTYACILMDIRMPVLDGLETTRAIRALDRSDAKTIPIIAMTANAFDDDVRHCAAAGMNDHLAKPVEAATLYKTIAKHLAK